jgi:hypothetical protein
MNYPVLQGTGSSWYSKRQLCLRSRTPSYLFLQRVNLTSYVRPQCKPSQLSSPKPAIRWCQAHICEEDGRNRIALTEQVVCFVLKQDGEKFLIS